jgi:response regulator RpfG family c-di-GMP phosphodiesterase
MPNPGSRVLIVDDDDTFAEVVSDALREAGFETTVETDPERAVARGIEGRYAAALVDLVMPGLDGLEVIRRIREQSPATEYVILTGKPSLETAVGGIHQGIFDYFDKSQLDLRRLERVVGQAIEKARLGLENRVLTERLRESNTLLRRVGDLGARIRAWHHQDRMLDELVSAAVALCGAARGRAVILEPASEDFRVLAAAGWGAESLVGHRVADGQSLTALAAIGGRAQVLSRADEHPAYDPTLDGIEVDLPGVVFVPFSHGNVRGALALAGREQGFGIEHREALLGLGRQAAAALDNAQQHERASNFFTHATDMLVSILDSVDTHYEGHARRVAMLADAVSRRLGLGDDERRAVHFGALLHDIGKLRLGPTLINASSLSETELRRMREHPALGLDLVRPITAFEDVLPVIYAHHERWDGSGYPRGLAGEEIPLGARIVSVADAFDNMLRTRPWAALKTPEEAIAELESCAGSQFDPRVVRLFAACWRESGEALIAEPNR